MTETSLVRQQGNGAMTRAPEPILRRELSLGEVVQLGAILAASKYFRDALGEAQCVVKVLAGMELGVPPLASMSGIHIIEGKPTVSGPLLASLIKRSGKYDFRPLVNTDERCEIAFYQHGEEIGRSSWSMEDAKRAQLLGNKNWQKHPRQMLLWRTLGEGARIYCADVLNGVTPYVSEEMGGESNADGEPVLPAAPVIDVASRVSRATETEGSYAETVGLKAPSLDDELAAEWERAFPGAGLKAVGAYAERVLGRKLTKAPGAARDTDLRAVLQDLASRDHARRRAFATWNQHRETLQFGDPAADEGNEMRVVLGLVLGREVESRKTLAGAEWDKLTLWLETKAAEPEGGAPVDPFVGEV